MAWHRPPRHSRPPHRHSVRLTVIPAKAGIHTPNPPAAFSRLATPPSFRRRPVSRTPATAMRRNRPGWRVALTVIPAKAGIHTPNPPAAFSRLATPPSFRRRPVSRTPATAMRRNRPGWRVALTVIPAQAGIQNPGNGDAAQPAGLDKGQGVDSRFRGNDGGGGRESHRWRRQRRAGSIPGFWIPACAGMTVGRQWRLDAMALSDCGVWIPAFAGMTGQTGMTEESG